MSDSPGGGLLASLRGIATSLHAMLLTRVELASAELAQARDHLVASLALLVIAAVFLFLALVAASLWVAVIFWDTHRVEAVGGLALAYAFVGLLLGLAARRRLKAMPGVLDATLEELRLDAQALRGAMPRQPGGAPPAPQQASGPAPESRP